MKRPLKFLFAGIVALMLCASVILIDWFRFLHQPLITEPAGFVYRYEPGGTLSTLIDALQREGQLNRPLYFKILAQTKGVSRSLQAGEYYFAKGTSAAQLLKQLSTGRVIQHALTLIEGWNIKDVLTAVHNDPNLIHTLGPDDEAKLASALSLTHIPPEGLFYPDTYHFPAGMTDLQFLKRAHFSMLSLLNLLWDDRDKNVPYKTPYEALIVASLIEKETAVPTERPLVASVIVSRLKNKMLLQIDPTVIYAVTREHGVQLTKDNLAIDSPYNTYKHLGLPPTPIAIPGVAALHAALHPALTSYLYFVATGDGTHHFSETLDEHNRAVQAYRAHQQAGVP